jgi:hypothetical protein
MSAASSSMPRLLSGAAQCGGDAGLGELGRVRGGGDDGEHRTGFRFSQVGGGFSGEGVHERWVVLVQDRPQLVGGFAAAPDRLLLRARQNRDRLGEFAVGGQRAVHVGINAQDVRQRHRIGVVGLRASDRRQLSIAGHGHRVDREHRPPTGTRGGDQQPARVSIAIGIGSSGLSRAAASIPVRAVNPAGSPPMRFFATSFPSLPTIATS